MSKQRLARGRNVHMDITWGMESQICLILHFSILDLQLKVIQFIEVHFQKAQIKQQM